MKCIYYPKGCGRFQFIIILKETEILSVIYGTLNKLKHSCIYKNIQLRAVHREITKQEIKYQRAADWRNKKLIEQKKNLRMIGNKEIIIRIN